MFNFFSKNKHIQIGSPLCGCAVDVRQVNNPAFSESVLGVGIAVKPSRGRILSPASGTVDMIFETGHAISLLTHHGVELLIYVTGLDRARQKGRFCRILAHSGKRVKKGDVLVEFDADAMAAAGVEVMAPVVVTNSSKFKSITVHPGQVEELSTLFTISR